MLNTEDDKETYIDPYIKQHSLEEINNPSYRDYDETTQHKLESENNIFDYSQYDVENIRYKRSDNDTSDGEVHERFLTPLYVITAIFAAMLIIGPFLVKKGPNRGIVQACIMLAAFCMWIFWFTIYFGQMNPLMGPRLENTTVAWIAYKIGNPITAPTPPGTTEESTTTTEPTTPSEEPPEEP